ncbi:hypothetical protein TUM4261_06070 [Shewanella sp. c952]|nr:hypothetical protein TUM4261_06070 [Shewanella sp. c952]
MFYRSQFSKPFLLVIYITFATVGGGQAGYLIGLAAYSEDFSFSAINSLQISLLGLGCWGIFELVSRLKKMTLEPQ